MVFLVLSPLWVCRIGKKNHTLSQNNEIRTNYNDLLSHLQEFEIFPFEVIRAIIVLLWFFLLMHLPILTIR